MTPHKVTPPKATPPALVPAAPWLMLSVALAYGLKRSFAGASVDDLKWVLGPTATLVEWASGHDFRFEVGVGYVSRTALLAITKACAGLNFLAISSVLLSLLWVPGARGPGLRATWLGLAWLVGGLTTLVVNSGRVLLALSIHGPHRVEGTALYFGSLLLLAQLAAPRRQRQGTSRRRPPVVVLTTSAVYLVGTLLIPWLNGAAQGARGASFREHAGSVLLTTSLLALGAWWLLMIARRTVPTAGASGENPCRYSQPPPSAAGRSSSNGRAAPRGLTAVGD